MSEMLREEFVGNRYFNWDDTDDRALILNGKEKASKALGSGRMMAELPLCVLDELHKYRNWRNFRQGFFDKNEKKFEFLSPAVLHRKHSDEVATVLMGRYFPYTLHPISVAECLDVKRDGLVNRQPASIAGDEWEELWRYGGFPEPFLRASQVFCNRWKRLQTEQLFRA